MHATPKAALLAITLLVSPRAIADELVTLPMSALPELGGSQPPSGPIPLSGAVIGFVAEPGQPYEYVGTFVLGEPTGNNLPIVGGTLGSGYVVETGSGEYTATFSDLSISLDLSWHLPSGTYRFDIGSATGTLFFGFDPPVPPPFDQRIRPGLISLYGSSTLPKPKLDFYQFCSTKVCVIAVKEDGSNTEIELCAPPGLKTGTSGNGGGPPNPATGQGMATLDGSTQYVDSSTPGTPGYLAGGGNGVQRGQVAVMNDAPQPHAATFQLVLGSVTVPDGYKATEVRYFTTFTTYAMENEKVVYKWVWHSYWVADLETNMISGSLHLVSAGPATGMTPNQEAALNNFVSGGFAGAPYP